MRSLLAVLLLLLAAAPSLAQTETPIGIHIGVATCAGSNCHGATQRPRNSYVPGNEYLIWSKQDKHRNAYNVLLQDRAIKMARALGLPDAANQKLCLDCHADNVASDRRGVQFQLSDGVGCEACHGGASRWLGIHISGATHAQNVAAGLYPTEQPVARAEKCLGCHYGDETRFADHRLYGAGHPRLAFELDTYTAIEPAHFVVNQSYVERIGRPNDVQIWGMGQANDVKMRMDLILDPNHAPKGVDYELSLFDCEACHHSMKDLQWQARASTGLPPGRIKLYDATTMMLIVVAQRVAPDSATALAQHLLALHAATGDNWDAVKREATAVRAVAEALIPQIAAHDFTQDDASKLSHAVVASALDGNDLDYSGAQQQVMALESIVAAMKLLGFADDKQLAALNEGLNGLYAAVADDQKYTPGAYVEVMKAFSAKLPQ